MKQLLRIFLLTLLTTMLSSVAHANMGPAIVLQFSIHFLVLTWVIGLGEGMLLCTLLRAWKLRSLKKRIFISMIAANFISALLGLLFVKSTFADRIMGDVTIENLISVFWTMVYVTFVLTMIIEFPFFLVIFYGRKRWVLNAAATTLLVHSISYYLLFSFYHSDDRSMSMVTKLEVVQASTFEMKEGYDLYYISPDGKQVMRSDLAGKGKEAIATLDIQGMPDRLSACPRNTGEEKDGADWKSVQGICCNCGFDLFVIMNIDGKYKKQQVIENFSPRSSISIYNGEYIDHCNEDIRREDFWFRSFGNAKNWEFWSGYIYQLSVNKIWVRANSYTRNNTTHLGLSDKSYYSVATPFTQWLVQNGTHVAGDYGVFQLGKDQICIMDPEKKRIALIARGFGPVVAKPPLEEIPEKTPEATNEQTANEAP